MGRECRGRNHGPKISLLPDELADLNPRPVGSLGQGLTPVTFCPKKFRRIETAKDQSANKRGSALVACLPLRCERCSGTPFFCARLQGVQR